MPATLTADIVDHIGDGSDGAEHLPLYAVSILDEIAEARRQRLAAHYVDGLTVAYRAVMRHRFAVRYMHGAPYLRDVWTGGWVNGLNAAACVSAANKRNADMFVARIDRDIAEGGL